MKKYLGVALAVLLAIYGVDKARDDGDKDTSIFTPITSPVAEVSTGNWIYMDDIIGSLAGGVDGDTNSTQDLMSVLSMGLSKLNSKPAFIGVTVTGDSANKTATMEIIKATALNIPVYQGHDSYRDGDSELGRRIIELSQQGKINIVVGGTVGDLAFALKNGAHAHNITLYALMRKTWNAEGDASMAGWKRKAMADTAAYVASRLSGRIVEVVRPDYYDLIYRSNLPAPYQNTESWINKNRTNEAWDLANSNYVITRNAHLNKCCTGITNNTGQLRIADVLAMAEFAGVGRTNYAGIFNSIQHGLDIMQDRVSRGAKHTIVFTEVLAPEPAAPVDRSTFNIATAKPYDTGRNPLRFTETAKITRADLTKSTYIITHTKDGKWKGVEYQPKRFIDGNDSIISFNRSDKTWYVFPFEYSLIGENKRPKGWGNVEWIEKGDPVGLMSNTNVRGGQWTPSGQRQERSNIVWRQAQ